VASDMYNYNGNHSKSHNVIINVYSVLRMLKYNASPTKWKVLNEREKADNIAQMSNMAKPGINWTNVFIGGFFAILLLYIFNTLIMHGSISAPNINLGGTPAATSTTLTTLAGLKI